MIVRVVNRTEDTDNALKKFFKSLLQRFSEEHPQLYTQSSISDILPRLN